MILKDKLSIMLILSILPLLFACNLSDSGHTLSINITPEGAALVETDTQSTYKQGSAVSVQVTPLPGFRFDHWEDGLEGNQNPSTIIMEGDTTITAVIELTHNLDILIDGEGVVKRTVPPNSRSLPGTSARLSLEAVPAPNWHFDHWEGAITGNQNPALITLKNAEKVTAVFNKKPTWNVLLYIDGDNNLEPFAIDDFNESELIGSSDNVHIYALFDRIHGYDSRSGDWTGTRLYKIEKDRMKSPDFVSTLIDDFSQYGGELDMSDYRTLRDFIIRGNRLNNADRTLLVLWNHGGGVWPRTLSGSAHSPRGIAWDDTTWNGQTDENRWFCLTTDEVTQALAEAQAETGKKIDLLNTDACNMQLLEFAYETRNSVDYLVGSQLEIHDDGNDYEGIFKILTEKPSITPENFAREIVNLNNHKYDGGDTAYSVLALGDSFDTFFESFKTFAEVLGDAAVEDQRTIRDCGINYSTREQFRWYKKSELTDLFTFAQAVAKRVSSEKLRSASESLLNAFPQTVVHHQESGTFSTVTHALHGISVLLPENLKDWENYSGQNQYVRLKMSQDSQWDEFIQLFITW